MHENENEWFQKEMGKKWKWPNQFEDTQQEKKVATSKTTTLMYVCVLKNWSIISNLIHSFLIIIGPSPVWFYYCSMLEYWKKNSTDNKHTITMIAKKRKNLAQRSKDPRTSSYWKHRHTHTQWEKINYKHTTIKFDR